MHLYTILLTKATLIVNAIQADKGVALHSVSWLELERRS